MKFLRLTLLSIAVASTAHAAAIRVIDGDTVVIAGENIRIYNIDAPELGHAKCDAEKRLAQVAKRRVGEMLAAGVPVITRGDKGRMTDRYGRTLAVISVSGQDIGDALVGEGLARRWTGKRAPWCK